MSFYFCADPDFFDAVTTPSLDWRRGLGSDSDMPMRLGKILLGDEDSAPSVTMLELPPGGVLPRHAHRCWRFEVIVRGSIETSDGKVLGPGDVMISPPGEMYGPHTAGPEGVLTAEVFSQNDAALVFEDPELQADFDRRFAAAAAAAGVAPSS
jgi:predicted metal-dependent enzyme (double-stranded beta helix superfamily)